MCTHSHTTPCIPMPKALGKGCNDSSEFRRWALGRSPHCPTEEIKTILCWQLQQEVPEWVLLTLFEHL